MTMHAYLKNTQIVNIYLQEGFITSSCFTFLVRILKEGDA